MNRSVCLLIFYQKMDLMLWQFKMPLVLIWSAKTGEVVLFSF